MREILFRGKRKDNNELVYGQFVQDFVFYGREDYHAYIVSNEHPSGCFGSDIYIEVIPETVGQYTGLHDSTKWEQLTENEQSQWLKRHNKYEWIGKKIFEGDIVKYTPLSNRDVIYEVIWQQAYSRFSFVTMPPEKYRLYEFAEFDKAKYDCEIIGNIHNNPELTKGE